jgi:hypothetical protein
MSDYLEAAHNEYVEYSKSIKENNRFFVNAKYIDYFEIYISDNTEILEAGIEFYRSRIHSKQQDNELYQDNEIKMPPKNVISSAGRANPKGINYFYVASNKMTSITEVKPSLGDYLTIGIFKNTANLKILEVDNMSTVSGTYVKEVFGDIGEEKLTFETNKIMFFMLYLMNDFIRPIKGEPEVEYSPFQYFIEFCKMKGLDGIKYRSSLMSIGEDNFNFVFFSDNSFNLESKELVNIKSLAIGI